MLFKKSVLIIAFIVISAYFIPLAAESVFVKSGVIYEGKVVRENDNQVVLVLKDSTEIKIPRNNIIRILLHNNYKKKQYLNKLNGDVIEIYLVDEDQDSYTYRTDLYSSEEYRISKDDVDGITKKRRSVIQEKAAQDKKTGKEKQVKTDNGTSKAGTDGYALIAGAGFPYGLFGLQGAYYWQLNNSTSLAPYFGPGVVVPAMGGGTVPLSLGSMLIYGERHRFFVDLTCVCVIGEAVGGSLSAGYEFCSNSGIIFRISAGAAFIGDSWCPYPLPAIGVGYKF